MCSKYLRMGDHQSKHDKCASKPATPIPTCASLSFLSGDSINLPTYLAIYVSIIYLYIYLLALKTTRADWDMQRSGYSLNFSY